MTRDVLLVSAADARFYPMLQSMLATLRPQGAVADMDIACFDIGLAPAQREMLDRQGVILARPVAHLDVDPARHDVSLLSFLSRPFLPHIFPGYRIYVWVDSDIWFQQPGVLRRYIDGAEAAGFAITHERARGYRLQPWLLGWTAKHFMLGYGGAGFGLLLKPHLNAGLFAGRADAPHWQAWADCYQAAIARTGSLVPHDQFALNQALHGNGAACAVLEPSCNWIVDRGVPMWNDGLGQFCHPYPPYAPIAALHLAGPGKREVYDVRRTAGGHFRTGILPGARPGASRLDAFALAPLLAPALG